VEVLDHQRAQRGRRGLERGDHRLNGGVAELGEERRLPVVERAPREGVVQERVDDRVRHRLDEIHGGRPERRVGPSHAELTVAFG